MTKFEREWPDNFSFDVDTIDRSARQFSEPHPRARLTRKQTADISSVLDGLIVFLSFVVAESLYPIIAGAELRIGASYTLASVVAGLLYYMLTRSRSEKAPRLGPSSVWSVLKSLVVTFAIVIVIGYGLKQAEIHSRLWTGLSFMIAFALIVLKDYIFSKFISMVGVRSLVVERIALLGETSIAKPLKGYLANENDNQCEIEIYDVCGGGVDELRRLIADGLNRAFDRIVLCMPPDQTEKISRLIDAVSFLPARIEVSLAQAELQMLRRDLLISPCPILIDVSDRPLGEWASLVKRILDVMLSWVALIALAPLMVVVAIAIKLESNGPVFFRQRRHGWNHSIFWVWKFRTMTVQEDDSNVKQATQNDPRVTRVGRFLRRTSIDELPQLFNVLGGEMSLVGPRPHALVHNMKYSALIASYASRHKVKPGITGWAQIKGLRGNSEDVSKMIARADADLWYIRNWSILLDLQILTLTPVAVLLQKNAL